MENTGLKAEDLKPVILKAGVPLAVSLAGFIYAWIMAKKSLSKVTSPSEELTTAPTDTEVLPGSSAIHGNPCLEQEFSGLRSRIEGLQMRELAIRLQFEHYCGLKEQESPLMEIKNMLSLETARVEFLDREILSMETQNKRLENFAVQYRLIIEQLEYWKSENRMVQRKFQKLLRKSKAQSRLIKKQTLKIKGDEEEILRNRDALQIKMGVINESEDKIRELQRVLDQLQDEKNELLKKLDTAEKLYAPKVEAEDVSKEDYSQVLNELEQVKKERAAEAEELIHLRCTNACLRGELTRHQEQKQRQDQDRGDRACSKSRKLVQRLKRLVE